LEGLLCWKLVRIQGNLFYGRSRVFTVGRNSFFPFLKLNVCCRELGLRFCGFWKEEEEGGVEGGRLLEVWHHWDW
jgi:hypothetical protein